MVQNAKNIKERIIRQECAKLKSTSRKTEVQKVNSFEEPAISDIIKIRELQSVNKLDTKESGSEWLQ